MQLSLYVIQPSIFILREKPQVPYKTARDFNDAYHLFLNKFAKLYLDPAPTAHTEAKLNKLLSKIIELKRMIDSQE